MDTVLLHDLAFGLGDTLHLLQSITGPVKLGTLTSNKLMRLIREWWWYQLLFAWHYNVNSQYSSGVSQLVEKTPDSRLPRREKRFQMVDVQITELCMNMEGTGLRIWLVHVHVAVFMQQELFSLVMHYKHLPHRWSWLLDETSAGTGIQIPNK